MHGVETIFIIRKLLLKHFSNYSMQKEIQLQNKHFYVFASSSCSRIYRKAFYNIDILSLKAKEDIEGKGIFLRLLKRKE